MVWFKIGCITLILRSNDNDDGDDDDAAAADDDDDYDASYYTTMLIVHNMDISNIFIVTLVSNFTSHNLVAT